MLAIKSCCDRRTSVTHNKLRVCYTFTDPNCMTAIAWMIFLDEMTSNESDPISTATIVISVVVVIVVVAATVAVIVFVVFSRHRRRRLVKTRNFNLFKTRFYISYAMKLYVLHCVCCCYCLSLLLSPLPDVPRWAYRRCNCSETAPFCDR